jgi:D-lactate dehydrogenase
MCQTACPVLINTGDLVRRLRSEAVGSVEKAIWSGAGKAWKPVTTGISLALSVAGAVPAPLVTVPNRTVRAVLGANAVPLWSKDLPKGGKARRDEPLATDPKIVYFQSCLGTMFGPAEGSEGVARSFESLAGKAGFTLTRPESVGSLCCGTPWKSKGIVDAYDTMIGKTVAALWTASNAGRLPVVCDNSSCSEGLTQALETERTRHPEYASMRIVDAVDYAAEHILPLLDIDSSLTSLIVHPTCSSTRAGSNDNLLLIARSVASTAEIPDDWGCCAFAGDRGMLHPELTASATSREAVAVGADKHDGYVSCNRTCEIGMTRATGHQYQHVLELLDQRSTARG